jgi:hypothetical protein
MNEIRKHQPQGTDSVLDQHNLCELCRKKDDEDLYIMFSLLYRIIIGDIFYKAYKRDDMSYDLELLQEEKSKQIVEESKSSEEKMRLFQENVSGNILTEIIIAPEFSQLVQEIFKSKYQLIDESACSHQEFAKHFIQIFDVKDNQQVQSNNIMTEKNFQNKERLGSLLNSIRQLTDDIQNYQAEINKLSSHIVTRLFNSHTYSIEREISPNIVDEVGNNVGTLEAAKDEDMEKARNNNSDNNGSGSTRTSSGDNRQRRSDEVNGENNTTNENNQNNASSDLFENGTDTASNNNSNEKRKKSKALPFKSKLPKRATDILKKWFLTNVNNPYPSHEVKETLSKATGLTRKQIQNWFTNSRKRFLEPLKKKIEEKKSGDTTPHNTQMIEENSDPVQKPILVSQLPTDPTNIQQSSQIKTFPQFSPIFSNINDPQVMKTLTPQQFPIIPLQPQNQTFMYPGMMPQGSIPNGNNILIVPCFVQQPPMTYSFRPPNMVPINASFIQVPQGNIQFPQGNIQFPQGNIQVPQGNIQHPHGNIQLPQGNIQMIDQSNLISNSFGSNAYFVPLQPNMMEARGLGQNLSTNFNTINNNVYNSINNMGNTAPVGSFGTLGGIYNMPVLPNVAHVNNMDPNFGRMLDKSLIVMKPNQNDTFSEGASISPKSSQKNFGGVYHPRPEIDEYHTQKHLHKDYQS